MKATSAWSEAVEADRDVPRRRLQGLHARHIDVHLLLQLEMLISESHVTRAASRLGVSQPQMSAVLARLRRVFGDPLLVRTAAGMMPTDRALCLLEEVRGALQHIAAALGTCDEFDEARACRTWRLAMCDASACLLLPPLMQRLSQLAPGMAIEVRRSSRSRLREWLASGEVDAVVGYHEPSADGLHAGELLREPLVVVARQGPRADPRLSIQDFAARSHVQVGSDEAGASELEDALDRAMRRHGHVRKIACRAGSCSAAAAVVASTDLLATVPRALAAEFARAYPLRILALPLSPAPDRIRMLWDQRSQKDAGHAWLRSTLREAASGLNPQLRAVG